MKRLLYVKLLLSVFSGAGMAAIAVRFWKGLGASTGLHDYAPWGLWVGLDVMAGVALAAGGFVLCACVYIFRLEQFRPLLRATVLTAFLGYALVPIGLMLDLGLPWNIWHPMVYWQHHSFLFEVALCVMFYSTVLSLEFMPVVLEHPLFRKPLLQKIYRFLKKASLILVIAGIMLSTLHQSSLGALFLIMPFRTHPLWYSPLISLLFFVSAVGLGFAMIIFESALTSFLYRHKPKVRLLEKLGRASSAVLLVYLIIRLTDLYARGALGKALDGSWQGRLFIGELAVSVIIPSLLFNLKYTRTRMAGLVSGSVLVVAGFVLNRLNVSVITFFRPEGSGYFPSLVEIFGSLGLFASAALVFLFFVEHVNLFDGEVVYLPERNPDLSLFKRSGSRGPFAVADRFSALSMAFVFAAAAGFSAFTLTAGAPDDDGSVLAGKAHVAPGSGIMRIDNGDTSIHAAFDHAFHQDTLGRETSCVKCHHMNVSGNEISPCYQCHRRMYAPVSIFDHRRHEALVEDRGGCAACHPGERTAMTFRPCRDCHSAMYPEKLTVASQNYIAPSYQDAMHGQCTGCHEEEWKKAGRPTPDYCSTCHKDREGPLWREIYGAVLDSLEALRREVPPVDSCLEWARSPADTASR